MKYAVEIAETNSLGKAAERLYVGQSALSRAVKELESSLGVTLFERSAKGMTLTPDGEAFVGYARGVLSQVDNIEKIFRKNAEVKRKFSLSAPRSSYVCDAFTRFSKYISECGDVEAFYRETSFAGTVKDVLQDDFKLGVVRYASEFDKYYKSMLEEKGLSHEFICEFSYVLLVSVKSPLAQKSNISYDDLSRYIEIMHANPFASALPFSETKKAEKNESGARRIYVFDRAAQFELLSANTDTFMWVSPVPDELLSRYGLCQLMCEANDRLFKDVLIRRNDYTLSELDKKFIEMLVAAKRDMLSR